MLRRVSLILTLCLLGATDLCAGEAVPSGPATYDDLIAGSKKAMMADPNAALQRAQAAEAIADRLVTSPDRSQAIATSLWLEAEALTRVNKIGAARVALDRAIRLASEDGRITKLDGDLALSDARIADNSGDVAHALKSFQKAHDIFAKLGNARSQSIALEGLGTIYDEAHDFAARSGTTTMPSGSIPPIRPSNCPSRTIWASPCCRWAAMARRSGISSAPSTSAGSSRAISSRSASFPISPQPMPSSTISPPRWRRWTRRWRTCPRTTTAAPRPSSGASRRRSISAAAPWTSRRTISTGRSAAWT